MVARRAPRDDHFLAAHEHERVRVRAEGRRRSTAPAWREPYDAEELQRFDELAARADDAGVRFGFAISPGLDITYEVRRRPRGAAREAARRSPTRRRRGSCCCSTTSRCNPGSRRVQADLATWLLGALRAAAPDATLTVCPTEYVGMQPSPYLADLAAGLPPTVDVMWTGPTVCSPTITAADARARAAALGGRPPLVWDNYPGERRDDDRVAASRSVPRPRSRARRRHRAACCATR